MKNEEIITKQSLVDTVLNTSKVSAEEAKRIVNTVFDTITQGILDKKEIRIHELMKIEPRITKPHLSYIVKGKTIEVPATNSVKVIISRTLKNKMNDKA